MLTKHIRNLWSNVYFFLIQHNTSVKRKPKVKRLSEKKCNTPKDLESGLPKKEAAEKVALKLLNACFSVH